MLKNWADEVPPPAQVRTRLQRLARHLSPPFRPSPLRSVFFEPFVPLDWPRFTYNWENTQIFQLGLPWNHHIA